MSTKYVTKKWLEDEFDSSKDSIICVANSTSYKEEYSVEISDCTDTVYFGAAIDSPNLSVSKESFDKYKTKINLLIYELLNYQKFLNSIDEDSFNSSFTKEDWSELIADKIIFINDNNLTDYMMNE